ncbi:MAG: histidinol dehydrogenase [Gammaproteobacteria bacterium]|nr:histidinol dehydrogenase [Gammaproteobacteria bacterium]
MAEQVNIRRLSTEQADFAAALETLLDRRMIEDPQTSKVVADILHDVRTRGDQALVEYSRRFDRFAGSAVTELEVSKSQMQASLDSLEPSLAAALHTAADRIRRYHERQIQPSWQYEEDDGSVYGQVVVALERVGIYVPGGKANYPSSVLMNAIPAKVAGVDDVIAVVPTPYGADAGGAGRLIFAAAAVAGVDRLFTIGGAQAIAALAFGTETIPRVDKITGPGNVYVTAAKKQVFGEVGIDMIAGPSELTVVCDGKTDPDWIAMDLFSQAEHDEQAQSILISTDKAFLDSVSASIARLLPTMERRDIIATSMQNRGALIYAPDLEAAMKICNQIAPEHLELSVDEPELWLKEVRHAGAIFMGRHTPEALGDYCAGPCHVLPTSGTARFFSPLGVYDFQKRSSIINCSPAGAARLAPVAEKLAQNEHLQAHALSAAWRIPGRQ